jgi:glycosyltransferase involved in cell wall biosynthesis
MRKTSLPTALVYGWNRFGRYELESDVYWEENLIEKVVIHSYRTDKNVKAHLSKHKPDIILVFGEIPQNLKELSKRTDISSKIVQRDEIFDDNVIANIIVCQSTFWACKSQKEIYGNKDNPILSIFTPTYKTEKRIFRTYKSLVEQTYQNWEWVVVDDSPEDHNLTWQMLNHIASLDDRVKIYRIQPNSGGNVGEAKHRAAMLCDGEWLFELDHDDWLISTCLEDVLNASKKYPDAGFIYTDVTEINKDNSPRQYGYIGDDWYGHPENMFVFAYAGHTWKQIDGKRWLVHHYPEINPKTIRFNIGMPNHCRVWNRDTYHKIRGHSRNISVADDLELIIKTFLETKFIHVRKMLYVQYNNGDSTVDNNRVDINRRARLIRDYYDFQIKERFEELGKEDWLWDDDAGHSIKQIGYRDGTKYYENEGFVNYIID